MPMAPKVTWFGSKFDPFLEVIKLAKGLEFNFFNFQFQQKILVKTSNLHIVMNLIHFVYNHWQ